MPPEEVPPDATLPSPAAPTRSGNLPCNIPPDAYAGPALILVIGVARPRHRLPPGLASRTPPGRRQLAARSRRSSASTSQGGLRGEYQALPADGKTPGPEDMAVITDIIERRVNQTGVAEPIVQTQGSDRIVVELPGVTDPETGSCASIGPTGRLDFVPLGSHAGARRARSSTSQTYPPLFSGDQIPSATVGTDQNGRPRGRLRAQGRGRRGCSPTTRPQHVGELLRDRPRRQRSSRRPSSTSRSPTARSRSPAAGWPGSRPRRRQNLVTVLKFGSLPFPIEEVAPAADQRDAGRAVPAPEPPRRRSSGSSWSSSFMLIYYRLPGVVASIALIYYTLVVYAIFRLIPVTLTLAGDRGLRALGGHGGRRQHPDLRADQGGAAARQDAAGGHRGRASTAPGTRSSTRTCRASSPRPSCTTSDRRSSAASRSC